jgi:hypothetical protein
MPGGVHARDGLGNSRPDEFSANSLVKKASLDYLDTAIKLLRCPPVKQLEGCLQHCVCLLGQQCRLQHTRKELLRVHAAGVVNIQRGEQVLQLVVSQVRSSLQPATADAGVAA